MNDIQKQTISQQQSQVKSGYIFGLIAYMSWGIIPLYFNEIKHLNPLEILSHRIVWSLLILFSLVLIMNLGKELLRVLTTKKLLLILLLSSVLLATNWLLYIYATTTQRVSEASLGYYMMPLFNAFMGWMFLGERLRPLHYPALFLVAVAVCIPAVVNQSFTWLAVSLAVSFGFYGLVRKKAPIESLVGLMAETIILLFPASAFLIWQAMNGKSGFGVNVHDSFWLSFGGIATVVPLLTFTLSIRRLPLLAVSFMQFLSPTIQIIVAVFLLNEKVTWDRWLAIGVVLLAVVIFIVDTVLAAKSRKQAAADAATATATEGEGEV